LIQGNASNIYIEKNILKKHEFTGGCGQDEKQRAAKKILIAALCKQDYFEYSVHQKFCD